MLPLCTRHLSWALKPTHLVLGGRDPWASGLDRPGAPVLAAWIPAVVLLDIDIDIAKTLLSTEYYDHFYEKRAMVQRLYIFKHACARACAVCSVPRAKSRFFKCCTCADRFRFCKPLYCTACTVYCTSHVTCTLDFIPRLHQPIRFVVTSSHANLIGSCDPGSVTITSNLQRYLAS